MLKTLKEFREFAVKGNVVDMAVGVIIGAAFGKIVTSLVNDVIMPPVGLLLGGVNFSHLYINLGDVAYDTLEAAQKAGAPIIKYGVFMQTVIDFLIVAWVIFMMVKFISNLARKHRHEAAAAPAEPTRQEVLLTEIRDALRTQRGPSAGEP